MEFEKIRESFEKSINLFTTRDSVLEFHKSVSHPLNRVVYLIKNAGIKTVISTSYHNQSNTNELYYKDFNEDKVTLLKNLLINKLSRKELFVQKDYQRKHILQLLAHCQEEYIEWSLL